jgi:hypothetical protein
MYRPACRINQTGVYGTGWRRQARIKGLAFSVSLFSGFSFRDMNPKFRKLSENIGANFPATYAI